MRYSFKAAASVLGLILAAASASLGSEDAQATATPHLTAPEIDPTPTGPCCKVCKKGKACGNSCIARDRICHQPPGCACDG